MCFSTCLDQRSESTLQIVLQVGLFGKSEHARRELSKPVRMAAKEREFVAVEIQVISTSNGKKDTVQRAETYWLPKGSESIQPSLDYVITPHIARNLRNLSRATSTVYPVLIQGMLSNTILHFPSFVHDRYSS